MTKSACVVPWSTLDVSADGTPIMCCQAPIGLTVDGRPAAIDRDSLDAIWNAPEIVNIRAQMARGEAPEACRVCHEHERAGATSLRMVMNGVVHGMMGADWSLAKLMRETAKSEFRLGTRPKWYQLQFGNTC